MQTTSFTSRQIAVASALAAISAVVQLIHVGYQSPTWGMWIDVVSVTWIVAYFLFGIRLSLLVSAIGAMIITLFSPDTWLGASMKLLASAPVIIALYGGTRLGNTYNKAIGIVVPLIVGISVRCLIVLPFNYYYAIPIWTGMTPEVAMRTIPWFVIVGFNIVQSLVDVILAWIIVYRFKLNRFASEFETNV